MTETSVSVGPRWQRIAIALICVVAALNLFVPPIGTSLAVEHGSRRSSSELCSSSSPGNPRARVIGLGVLGVLIVLVAVQALVA